MKLDEKQKSDLGALSYAITLVKSGASLVHVIVDKKPTKNVRRERSVIK